MSRFGDIFRALVLVLLVLPAAAEEAQGDPSPIPAEFGAEGRDLYLEVYLNGRPTGLIAGFHERPDGVLTATPEELQGLGIRPGPADEEGRVVLNSLPGLTYVYDEPTQTVHFDATDEARETAKYSVARPGGPETIPVDRSGYGVFANYSLFASLGGRLDSMDDLFQGVSGALDAHFYSPVGVLSQSGVARLSSDYESEFIRLDSYWSYSDPENMITYRAGDLISGGLSWSRPVRLGGGQVQRNFELRPDLITRPLPSFSGSAAVPTTADIYIDNVKRKSVEVDDGPFVLDDLPASTGGGTAQVVLRDIQGRQIITELPFYASPAMLKKGLLDFSIEAGVPRFGFGDRSFDYAETPFGSATARYGAADWLTLEGHAEGGEDFLNGGAGAVFTLAHLGEGSLAVAGSSANGESGMLVNASVRFQRGAFSLFGRTQRTFGDYHDIASFSALSNDAVSDPIDARVPKELDQIGVSFPLVFDRTRVNVNYTRRVNADDETRQIVGASLSRPLTKRASLHVSAFADLEEMDDFGVFARISIPLGGGRSAATGARASSSGVTAFAEASKSATREPGSVGWRAQAAYGEDTRLSGAVTYRASIAQARGAVALTEDTVSATASLDGAFGLAEGAPFVSNRVDDALGVVDVGAPGVEVFYENRPIGMTGQNGKLVVPHLRSYQRNRISIDPSKLPVDARVQTANTIVSPHARSGVRIDFGVATAPAAALVTFVLPSGEPVPLGSSGQVDGTEETFLVGYDGETYIEGLQERNAVSIRLPDRSRCEADFNFRAEEGEQVWLKDVVCAVVVGS